MRTSTCLQRNILFSDDWELLSVDGATDVIAWMGEFSSTHWFPGYLGVAIHKPVSTLGEMKYMKGFATMDSRAVRENHKTSGDFSLQ